MIFNDYSPQSLAATVEHLGTDELLKQILVPVDFSDCADNAIRFAVAIALRTGAKIRLFHAVQLPLQSGEVTSYPLQDLEKDAAKRLGKKVEEIMLWLERERFRRLQVSHEVHLGFASEEIVRAARRGDTDLIVMGTHGASTLAGKLIGSNAAFVLQGAHCPVMVVPQGAEFAGFKRIAYASDMSEVNRPAIQLLADFAGHFDAELHVLHVVSANDPLTPEQANAFKDQFTKAAHYPKASFHIVDAEDDGVVHTIEEYTRLHGVEVVATLSHQRGFWSRLFQPSMTKRLALHATKPLLALH